MHFDVQSNDISKPENINEALLNYQNAKKQGQDSLLSISLLELVKEYRKNEDWPLFNTYRFQHINNKKLGKYWKERVKILTYSASYFRRNSQSDSTYYYERQVFDIYEEYKDSLRAASSLLNMAIEQKKSRDYSGGISNSFKALEYMGDADNKRQLSSIYNNLGSLYNQTEDFDSAIKYHEKAYELRKGLTEKAFLQIHSLNNIGNTFKHNENYQEAISYYIKALEKKSLLKNKVSLKAKLLDNYAHAKLLNNDFSQLPDLFFEALNIRDSISDTAGITINHLHLAEFYTSQNMPSKAKKHWLLAKQLSKEHGYLRDYMTTLKMSKQLNSPKVALAHAHEHIVLSDSIKKAERRIKEQFSRVRFETDEKEKALLRSKQELQENQIEIRDKKIWILSLAIFALVLGFLTRFYFTKNRKHEHELKASIEQLNELKAKSFYVQDSNLENEVLKKQFDTYLKDKYRLTDKLLEIWKLQTEGLSEAEMAERIGLISKEGIRKRRNNLYKKLEAVENNGIKINALKSIGVFKKELIAFKASLAN